MVSMRIFAARNICDSCWPGEWLGRVPISTMVCNCNSAVNNCFLAVPRPIRSTSHCTERVMKLSRQPDIWYYAHGFSGIIEPARGSLGTDHMSRSPCHETWWNLMKPRFAISVVFLVIPTLLRWMLASFTMNPCTPAAWTANDRKKNCWRHLSLPIHFRDLKSGIDGIDGIAVLILCYI